MLLKAIGYNATGEAITIHNGKVFYVRGLIKGEEAICKIIKEEEKWGIAQIEQIIKVSQERNENVPDNHLNIGGYEIIHMSRDEQTNFKESKVKDDFKRNANHEICLSKMFVGKKLLRYRNKITLHDGAFYKRGSHEKIFLDDFLLTSIKPETSKKGDIIIRNLDTQIEGSGNDNLFTTDTLLGLKFRIHIKAFYQVNKEVAQEAYKEMISFIPNGAVVFDLYSGIGTITLFAAQKAQMVYGVERNKFSYKSALGNKNINSIDNVKFINDDVLNFVRSTKIKPDLVIVDPARDGLKKNNCLMLLDILPKRIIYLSCNPGTQAADFNRLKEKYEISHARIFDMFPQTHHIENLIVLDRKNGITKR